MVRAHVVIREVGKLKPDYSLEFDLPEIPRPGDYISIQRPDTPAPWGEDMIVRQVWWRLNHPETEPTTTNPKVGALNEVFVECDPAISPYSSDHWRDSLSHGLASGKVEELQVARFSVRQDEIK